MNCFETKSGSRQAVVKSLRVSWQAVLFLLIKISYLGAYNQISLIWTIMMITSDYSYNHCLGSVIFKALGRYYIQQGEGRSFHPDLTPPKLVSSCLTLRPSILFWACNAPLNICRASIFYGKLVFGVTPPLISHFYFALIDNKLEPCFC